jgi:hypothetical protein
MVFEKFERKDLHPDLSEDLFWLRTGISDYYKIPPLKSSELFLLSLELPDCFLDPDSLPDTFCLWPEPEPDLLSWPDFE